MPDRRLRAGAMAAALLAAGTATGTAACAQDVPQAISPLRVESDHNNVNLVDGKTRIDLPVLSVPGAPNLRFDRIQNAAPYFSGRVENTEAGDYPRRSYSVHTGGESSDSFRCEDMDCISVAGTGSTFIGTTYRQAGSGAVYHFTLKHVHTTGMNQALLYYAANVVYPNGETITYSYQTATLAGDPFNRTFYRPDRITSNLGFFISLTYQSDDFNGDTNGWNQVAQAAIYSSAAPTAPLRSLTYSAGGGTITDSGRVFSCQGCTNQLGVEIETAGGMTQLPGETSPALQAAPLPGAAVVGSVTRDGVAWTYAYDNLRYAETSFGYLYDRLTVSGPNGFHNVYDMTSGQNRNTITRVTDSIGRATVYAYDEYYRPVRIVSPEGNQVDIAYDQYGNINWRRARAKPGSGLADIVETAGYPTETCADAGTPILCYRPIWSRDGLGRQTDYSYNANGQLTEQTDPADANGVRRRTIVEYALSPAGISRRSVVRICGVGTTCGTGAEIRTEYQYWGNTSLPSLERRVDSSTGAAITLDTTFSYDEAGRLRSTDGPFAGSDDTSYNRYDLYGRRIWEIGARVPGGLRIARRFTYRDSDDRPVSIETGTLPDADSSVLTVFNRTDFAYDGRRNPVRETVSAGGTTFSVADKAFDENGRLVCSTTRMNPAAFGALPSDACAAGPPGGDGPDRIARTIYDAAGQRLQLREGVGTADEGTEASWAYAPNGQVATIIDGNGNRAELHYDGHGRQDRWTFPSASRAPAFNDAIPATALATAGAVNAADYEEYGYDAIGNRTSLRKRDGSVLTYTYDALNRIIVKTVPERADLTAAQTRDVYYSYDLRNLQLSARFDSPSGEGVTNLYDGFGRLVSSVFNMGGIPRTLGYSYDAAGNRTSITYPDTIAVTTQYDALGRAYFMHTPAACCLAYRSFLPHGAPDGISRADGSGTWMNYDAIQRVAIMGQTFPGGAGNVVTSFWRNASGQLAGQVRDNDAYAWTGHYAVNRAYATNGLNQYSAAGGATFAYDANGNLTSDGTRTYIYDNENRLVSSSAGAALVYDPLGRLFQVSTPTTGTTTFLYDGDALVVEYDGGNLMARRHLHWPGADVPMMTWERSGFDPHHLHADEHGSIITVDNANGLPTINTYDEYGIPGAGNVGRFQYTGQAWLPELGMYYYKARIYSPTLGRFLQTDPVGYEDQFNLYAYVGDDPISHSDPDGTQTNETHGGGGPLQQVADYVGWVASDIGDLAQGIAQGRFEWAFGGMPPTLGGGLLSGSATIARALPTIATGTRLARQASAAERAARGEAAAARAGGNAGGATSGLVTRSGRTFTGRSTNAGGPGRATNATVQEAVQAAPQGNLPRGCCAEVNAVSNAMNAGANVEGGFVATVRTTTGRVMETCITCQAVMRALGVRH